MLKYNIKITENDFKDKVIAWREKYIAPDLSFISGVTDYSYHLEAYDNITVYSPSSNQGIPLNLETEIVTRIGYIIARDKEYPIKTMKLSSDKDEVRYIEINGMFYYINNGKITINNWQCRKIIKYSENREKAEIVEQDVVKSVDGGDKYVKLDTVYWIEDGYVEIDGHRYFFDKNEDVSSGTKGCLKYFENGDNIDIPTKCSKMLSYPYESSNEIHEVCKFKATSVPFITHKVNRIDFNDYFFYANYKDNSCPMILSGDTFLCQISSGESLSSVTVSAYTEEQETISSISVDNESIFDMNDLVYMGLVTEIDGTLFPLYSEYTISNNSRYIMVDLKDQDSVINVGDFITFENSYQDMCFVDVEEDNDVNLILYDGNKYIVEDKLFDKVNIDGLEYDVTYDDFNDSIAYVNIEGEQVPMSLNGNKLSRYGLTMITSDSTVTTSSDTYSIVSYSGVTIEGEKYIVYSDSVSTYAQIDKPYRIKFTVVDIKGNSLLICLPYINLNEFSNEYIHKKQYELSNDVVLGQDEYLLQIKNTTFGLSSISKEMPFASSDMPISSDVYNLLNNIELRCKNGYVNIPINFNQDNSLELLKSEVIEKDFIEREKEKAINKIVDLEKDVYVPKYINNGNYSGSTTEFKPIFKINVNLHFRTRNLDNWKVNENYNDVTTSGTSNWFVTDYLPYRSSDIDKNELMEVSDLLGLLNFSDDDVYYQKSKLAKSFLRFSVYDSTDPQSQSLLSTSTVFVNEHGLYKKYIDNSRKNGKLYSMVGENEVIDNMTKISVNTEFYESKPRKKYNFDDSNRLSSRFVIENKYDTESSSEGFYMYIFREYSKKLRPKPLYMKIEFNHAGVGRTIPFIIPMEWEATNNGNEVNPKEPLTLNDSDLKKGVPLSYVQAQSYIPLYAVYDFKNKEYGYVFDNRYIGEIKNGVLNLNLFEIKIADESSSITQTNTKAVIDINKQFNGAMK